MIFDSAKAQHPFCYTGVFRLSPPKIDHVYKVRFNDGRIVDILGFPRKYKDIADYLKENASFDDNQLREASARIVMDLRGIRMYFHD